MALKGNLRDFTITQLLNLVNLAKKTGTLVVGDKADRLAPVTKTPGQGEDGGGFSCTEEAPDHDIAGFFCCCVIRHLVAR